MPKVLQDLEIKNLYSLLGNDVKPSTYELHDTLKIDLPFRIIITGKSGSMKSNLAINLIQLINAWDTILLFAKNIEQPLYQKLIERFESEGKTIVASNDLAELPDIDEIEDPTKTLVIFDDLLAERNLKAVEDYFLRGRNKGVSMIFIAQKHAGKSGIPLMIRENASHVLVKQSNRMKALKLMFDDYDLPEQAMDLYHRATRKPEDFFMIDLITPHDPYKIRHNFSPFDT